MKVNKRKKKEEKPTAEQKNRGKEKGTSVTDEVSASKAEEKKELEVPEVKENPKKEKKTKKPEQPKGTIETEKIDANQKEKPEKKDGFFSKLKGDKKSKTKYGNQKKGGKIFIFSSVTALLLVAVIGGTILNRRADFFVIAGVEFRPQEHWHVTATPDEAVVRLAEDGDVGVKVIRTVASNQNLTLEQNFDVIAAVTAATTENFSTEDIIIGDLPVRVQHYTITAGGNDFIMMGFLFPNGNELMYIQLGMLEEEGESQALIESTKEMIRGLNLPPIGFTRDADLAEADD